MIMLPASSRGHNPSEMLDPPLNSWSNVRSICGRPITVVMTHRNAEIWSRSADTLRFAWLQIADNYQARISCRSRLAPYQAALHRGDGHISMQPQAA